MKELRSKKALYPVQIAAAALAMCLSLYLLVQHTRLKSGIQGSASFCSFGKYADCDAVNASQYSEIGGIPLASLGAVFYFLILLLTCVARPSGRSFKSYQQLIARLATLGLLIDLGLLILQAVTLKNFCVLCVTTYLFTLIIAYTSFRQAAPEMRLSRFFKYIFGATELNPSESKGTVFATTVALVMFSAAIYMLPSTIRMKGANYTNVDNTLNTFYLKWPELPTREIPTSESDGVFGNPNAKIKIVEFSDFQCPHCRRAAFIIHTALKPLKDYISLTYKNYPLDQACNTDVTYQLHPHACAFARLAYCAEKKGKFWEYHDTVFGSIPEDLLKNDFSAFTPYFKDIFTQAEINSCLKDPRSLAHVQTDMKAARALGLRGTPTIFIDGKQVTIPLSVESIQKLIALEQGAGIPQ